MTPITVKQPTVAILVHVYRDPTPDEKISLMQLRVVLGSYPVFLTAPKGMPIGSYCSVLGSSLSGVERFEPAYFRDLHAYNRLLTSRIYYEAFSQYEYLLIHHPDAFVFRDELPYWTAQDFDYIGPPIYEYDGTSTPSNFICCGNGGFSLRKTSSFIHLLKSDVSIYRPEDILNDLRKYNWRGRVSRSWYYLTLLAGLGSRLASSFGHLRLNEDIIWGYWVPKYVPSFRVAPLEVGMKFGLEFNCGPLLAMNDGVLPFGCHGWTKPMFREFWKPHIEAMGYTLTT